MTGLTNHNNYLGVLIMATCILTKNLDPVLSCHQGLSAEEITYDYLEKARALVQVGLAYQANLSEALPLPYLSILDDWLELGLKYCEFSDTSNDSQG
jgi:hypothetical protein